LPELESDVVDFESVQQKAAEQAQIGERKQKRDIESGDDRVYALAEDAKEKEQVDVCRNA